MNSSSLKFRQGNVKDLQELKSLFLGTIQSVCSTDYGPEQIAVWTSSVENDKRWLELINEQFVLLAEKEGIVGFCSLDNGDYVDFLYVHKDHQGEKIALQLYQRIEEKAKKLGMRKLSSDVSLTARPFFEKMGFVVLKEQRNMKKGVELINFKMSKQLN